ncbi:hypothetical protein AVEN_52880-1 [Araneus ventricosus]|uniref:Uncharacterized protein n=1 Tax=Araneus ventricosus TaxID=182803 RepID=A0A4Y2LML7_ARAVE|nr:hypothetical protein AVEN_52880-1 [Araneus ventricosus]
MDPRVKTYTIDRTPLLGDPDVLSKSAIVTGRSRCTVEVRYHARSSVNVVLLVKRRTTGKGVSGLKRIGIYLVNHKGFKNEEFGPTQNLEHLVIDMGEDKEVCLGQNVVGPSPTTDNRNLQTTDISEDLAIDSQDGQ